MRNNLLLGILVVALSVALLLSGMISREQRLLIEKQKQEITSVRKDSQSFSAFIRNNLLLVSDRQVLNVLENQYPLSDINVLIAFPKSECGGCCISLVNMLVDEFAFGRVIILLETENEQIEQSFQNDSRIVVIPFSNVECKESIYFAVRKEQRSFISLYQTAHAAFVERSLKDFLQNSVE